MARKFNLEVVERDTKKNANVWRRNGYIPAEVYGPGLEGNRHIAVPHGEFDSLLDHVTETTLIDIDIEGKETITTFLKTIQRHRVSDKPIHGDFYVPSEGHVMTLHIPFEVEGMPIGVERDGGVLDILVHDIPVEILPKDVIEKIVVDISELEINDHIVAKDIKEKLPESAHYLIDDEELLVTITKPGISIEELEAEAEAEEESLEPEVIEESSDEEETEE